jgi:hypothetical protein
MPKELANAHISHNRQGVWLQFLHSFNFVAGVQECNATASGWRELLGMVRLAI